MPRRRADPVHTGQRASWSRSWLSTMSWPRTESMHGPSPPAKRASSSSSGARSLAVNVAGSPWVTRVTPQVTSAGSRSAVTLIRSSTAAGRVSAELIRAVISLSAATISTRCGSLTTSTRPSSPFPGASVSTGSKHRQTAGGRSGVLVPGRLLDYLRLRVGMWGIMSYEQQLVAERYRLASLIGSGGMGRVWLARDEVLRREVAVKEVVLPEDMTFTERNELCQRTLREARAAGRLSHPNVVAVYDVVQAEGRPWIVMELVRSRSLYQVVKEDGPVPPRRAAEIGLAVLAALRAAHQAGVWHRDVKPGNVLLADDGRVVLTDFGLATFEGDGTVTRSGVILGSAQYISPERARDGASGPESDLWSLGATLYAAVEGRSPYARDTAMATLTALATLPPDTPRRAGPLRPVLIGLLRKNPRHRMRAPEVERLLTRIVAGEARVRRGLLAPRQRALGEVGVEDASGAVAYAGSPARDGVAFAAMPT